MRQHPRSAAGLRRRVLFVTALTLAVTLALAGRASALGPGGWDHLGAGPNGTPPVNAAARAFAPGPAGVVYVGGSFTGAGGVAAADRIAAWNGSAWSAVGPGIDNGLVEAIAYVNGKLFVGGTFTNAGGNADADFLAVWDGVSWQPFCNSVGGGPPFGGTVDALQVIGSTLYVGGAYQNGAGIPSADYLTACDLNTGAASSTVAADGNSTGAVYALAADSNGALYAGGTFINMDTIPAADHVAYYAGGAWHAMGSGSPNGGAVNDIVRALAANGTDVYVGTDAVDVAGIAQADHVARWNGSAWSATGSDTAGVNGWFPASSFIYGMTPLGSGVAATGSFQNANGDPTADDVATFDGSAWHPVGSNGASDGPWIGNGLALGVFDQKLLAGGSFTSAGGDGLAGSAASYSLVPPTGPSGGGQPPPTDPGGSPVGLPAPTLGLTVNAVPEKGTVLVKLPAQAAGTPAARLTGAAAGFVPMTSARQLPLGTTFDTSRGTVGLTLAATHPGLLQTGHFSMGRFDTAQSKKTGLTTLSASGGGFAHCATRLPRGGSARVQAAARHRSLFSSVRGRFRTRGRNSSATVRGTQWLQKDTCAGTLTVVRSGSVTVRDFAKRRTVVVKSGKRYFARAPRKASRR